MTKVSPMYISPITIMQGEMNVRVENEIIKAVKTIGIDVDKEELIKALAYDRKQYEKGYEDGYENGKAEIQWIPCSERLPEYTGCYLTTTAIPSMGKTSYLIKYAVMKVDKAGKKRWYRQGRGNEVIAWMPLPEPYKEEE